MTDISMVEKTGSELARLGGEHRSAYQAATPWPHLVLDGLFDPSVVAEAEAQEIGPGLRLQPHRSHRQIKAERTEVSGDAARGILKELRSSAFCRFLEELTGVPGLVADPSHFWAGLHVGQPGSFQAVHRDFRKHPVTGLFHRVNVLLYLNSDWESGYGGNLELWSSEMKDCGRRISPVAGRMVIFETTPKTIHGVPDPVVCPPGRARLTLVSYYYSKSAGPNGTRQPYLLQPMRPQDSVVAALASPADAFLAVRRVLEGRLRRRSQSADAAPMSLRNHAPDQEISSAAW
jgi:hypothetical protein